MLVPIHAIFVNKIQNATISTGIWYQSLRFGFFSTFACILQLFPSSIGTKLVPLGLQNWCLEGSQWHLDPFSKECPEFIEFFFHVGR